MGGQIVNRSAGTAIPSYATSPYVEAFYFDPGFSEFFDVGQQDNFDDLVFKWSNGPTTCASSAIKSSNNTSIATVGAGVCPVVVTGVGPGITTISAEAEVPINESGVMGQVQAESGLKVVSCTVGLTSQSAVRDSGTAGRVKFRVTNTGCPSGGSNTVKVGIAGLDLTGSIAFGGVTPTNFSVPPGTGAEQEINFTVSGAGSIKFQVSITQCNNQVCSDLKWDRSPNNVQTNTLSFP